MTRAAAQTQQHPACKGTSKRAAWTGVAIVAAGILLVVVVVYNGVSGMISGMMHPPGSSDIYRQLTVGEAEEAAVRLPPWSWWDLDIDKPVIIRLANGEKYERRPDGLICKNECVGEHPDTVGSVGDRIPGGVIYLHAKKGGNMAKVTITTVRKLPAEANPPAVQPVKAPSSAPAKSNSGTKA